MRPLDAGAQGVPVLVSEVGEGLDGPQPLAQLFLHHGVPLQHFEVVLVALVLVGIGLGHSAGVGEGSRAAGTAGAAGLGRQVVFPGGPAGVPGPRLDLAGPFHAAGFLAFGQDVDGMGELLLELVHVETDGPVCAVLQGPPTCGRSRRCPSRRRGPVCPGPGPGSLSVWS